LSADNYIGVYLDTDRNLWVMVGGWMSVEMEDCQYRGGEISTHEDRAQALIAAHDHAKGMCVLEYGVIELASLPVGNCGHCYVCINERNIIADDVTRCTRCEKPIASGEMMTMTSEGNFHSACERGL
jgi:hypothetical protein